MAYAVRKGKTLPSMTGGLELVAGGERREERVQKFRDGLASQRPAAPNWTTPTDPTARKPVHMLSESEYERGKHHMRFVGVGIW